MQASTLKSQNNDPQNINFCVLKVKIKNQNKYLHEYISIITGIRV